MKNLNSSSEINQSPRRVPFFDYPSVFSSQQRAFLEIIEDVGRRGAFIMQRDLEEFETRLAEYLGIAHAVGVANATDGLQMAFMAGGLENGDEVIICSHTMIATASAVHFAGGVPIPVEAGRDHLIDPESVCAALTDRTRAICPTQLNGRTCDMDLIEEIATEHGLDVYEDAAQALGSRYKGRAAGSFGRAACISFYPAKVLGCLGDGGAVVTNDHKIYKRLLLLRDHGRAENGNVMCWGFNSRLDNLHAAILSHQLERYDEVVLRRREIAARYHSELHGCEHVVLPPEPVESGAHFDIYQNYEIEAACRDELVEFLKARGVGTLIQWGGRPVHQFSELGFNKELPVTDSLFERIVMLPMNTTLTDDDVEYVCSAVRAFYAASSG